MTSDRTVQMPVRLLELRSTYKGGGGPDKTILNSLKLHDTRRVEAHAIYIYGVEDKEFSIGNRARDMGLKLYHDIGERARFDWRVFRHIRDYIRTNHIDIIHSHETKTNFFAVLLSRVTGVKAVSTAHAWVGQNTKARVMRFLDMQVVRFLHRLFAVSSSLKEDMRRIGKIPAGKIHVVHNAIDVNEWKRTTDGTEMRKRLGLESAFPLIGAVGRLMPEKDIKTMLEVFKNVLANYPAARLMLVGEARLPQFESEYREYAKRLGISDSVIFHGFSSDLPPLYEMFDLYLMTSVAEGLPNVLLEAMALGLPVVATDVAGVKEVVDHGHTGYVCPMRDVETLTSHIVRLLADREKLKHFGAEGRRRVEQEFSFRARLSTLEDHYHELVRGNG